MRWCAHLPSASHARPLRHRPRTIGAQPEACTATIRGRFEPMNSDRLEFGERLPHPDQAGAAAGRIEDHVGPLPSRAVRRAPAPIVFLPSIRYGSFRVEVSEPAGLCLAFADDLATIIDQPVDAVNRSTLQFDLADIHFRRIGGQKIVVLMPQEVA